MSYHYLEILKRELERRSKKNKRYSIRAFARDLGVDHGTLASILKGKIAPSKAATEDFPRRLALSPEESQTFVISATEHRQRRSLELARNRHSLQSTGAVGAGGGTIQANQVPLFGDWFSSALLELTFVEGFQAEPRWMAERLGLPEELVKQKLDALIEAGYLAWEGSRLVKREPMLATHGHDQTQAELKNYQSQVLKKALESLDLAIEERNHMAMTMAIDMEKIPAARKIIAEFLGTLCTFLETGSRTRVYNCTVSLFPVSK